MRVLDSGGTGSSEHVAEGIRWATRNGADIINLSLAEAPGLVGGNGGIIGIDVETAIAEAHAAGMVVVAASGNEGRTSTSYAPESPVIVVGAANRQNQVWAPSNRDGRTLFAPGVEIISTYIQGGYARCQGALSSPHGRTRDLPADGHEFSPLVAVRSPRSGQWCHPLSAGGLGEADAVAGGG